MALGFLLFSLLAAPAASAMPVGSNACAKWFSDHSDDLNASGKTYSPNPTVRCFNGGIDQASAQGFIASLAPLKKADHPVIVVQSGGGSVDAGLAMARAIRRLGATVDVKNLCVSSCANYLFVAGRVRIVSRDGILGFHGGATAMTPAEVLRESEKEGKPDSPYQAKRASAHFTATARRQAAFPRGEPLKKDFYSWTMRFNGLSPDEKQRVCAGMHQGLTFVVFSPELLTSEGLKIDRYEGPRSAASLRSILVRYGMPGGIACYIDSPIPSGSARS